MAVRQRSAPGAVEIEIEPHPHFTRDGLDVLIDLPITIDEAALGGKVEVPTIAGMVSMTVPKGASSGRMLRLKGRGIQERVLKAVTEHGLGSREVAGLAELLRESSIEERERILREPRQALNEHIMDRPLRIEYP